ncbi:hypothetical protein C8Q75DRAFT_261835 [Abortiporus biennis]|nr:hypothetical protein C8Q75DRAFT_261835 [Abortiporus biennis]
MSVADPTDMAAPSSTIQTGDVDHEDKYAVMDDFFKFPTAHVYEHDPDRYSELVPPARFLDEIRMIRLMQTIIEKPNWHVKLHDDTIRQRWLQEAEDQNIRSEIAQYALKELEWCATVRNNTTGIEPAGIDFIWKSDKLIDSGLHDAFVQSVHKLEKALPEDFHPGSDGQVKNLIHPSLFCLVYGESVDNDGKKIQQPEWLEKIVELTNPRYYNRVQRPHPKLFSHRYQWLPAEFLVDGDNSTKIASYINGLPVHVEGSPEMYKILAEIFQRTVPLFENVLSSLFIHHGLVRFPKPYTYDWWAEHGGEPPSIPDEITIQLLEDSRQKGLGWQSGLRKYWEEHFNPLPPPIPEFNVKSPPLNVAESDKIRLGGHRLQVITKIGSILLTPERPDYSGGNWHVEGMANERIVATAIYYFDSENIEGDRLEFRQAVELDTYDFAQDDDPGAHLIWGLHRDEGLVQDLGGLSTSEGRVIVFPNIYQHAISPFSLKDKTKPGHRSILVFFLVDPTERITSTAHVPPQDPSWFMAETVDKMKKLFPVELQWEVQKSLSPMTRKSAEEHRLKLMEERTYATDAVTNEVFMRPFNLCEH